LNRIRLEQRKTLNIEEIKTEDKLNRERQRTTKEQRTKPVEKGRY
jgi:hypothetical protein